MANYTVVLSKKAQKELDKLSDFIAGPIIKAITLLEFSPRPNGFKKLKNRNGYRIRIGSYRVIYDVFDDKLIIEIIILGHRKDIYD